MSDVSKNNKDVKCKLLVLVDYHLTLCRQMSLNFVTSYLFITYVIYSEDKVEHVSMRDFPVFVVRKLTYSI